MECQPGWDGWDSWDVSPHSEILGDEKTAPLATRILDTLRASPAGVTRTDLERMVSHAKDASPALIELALTRLVKAGEVGRVNDRFVATGEASA